MSNTPHEIKPNSRPRRLRVLVWCPNVNAGGNIRLLGSLIPALARRPEVEVIRLLVPERATLPALEVGPVARLEIVPIPSRRQAYKHLRWLETSGRIFGLPGTLGLKRQLRKRLWETRWDWLHAELRKIANDCDVVYALWPLETDFPDFGKPVVCTYQDATIFDFPEILGGDRTNMEYRRARVWIERSAQVIVPSEATKGALGRQFGQAARGARVIHQAILPSAADTVSPDTETRQNLPDKYFICLASVSTRENLQNLLVAWSRFKRRYFFPLVLAGHGAGMLARALPDWPEGFQISRLAGLVRRLDVEVNRSLFVLELTEDEDGAKLIEHAYALIVPSFAEGGGNIPTERALMHGVPICCADIPELREQLEGRGARIGWFDPLSPESIVAALGDLVEDYAAYKAAALSGMKDERPTWDDIAQAYVDVFTSVAQRSRSA